MKIICRICGNEFDHPEGRRGKKPEVCQSPECKRVLQREYNANWRNHKDTTGVPKHVPTKAEKADLSKAGWPPDTKRCTDCGKLFIDEGKSRICPICKAQREKKVVEKMPMTPINPRPLDEVLAEAKAAGYDPEDFGKYKTAKALEKAGHVDVGLARSEDKKLPYDIYKETGFEGDINEPEKAKEDETVECKSCGFDTEPIQKDNEVECVVCGARGPVEEVFQAEPVPCETCKPASRYEFITAIEDLLHLVDTYGVDPEKAFPLAVDIMKNGFIQLGARPLEDDTPFFIPAMGPVGSGGGGKHPEALDPAWGFDRKARL